ncbi:siderophore ferric iron reductase [Aeromonas sobria]|uniref:siderophore ferric iron reductase n=1 Tax=Aeromonas sobria TaxID=646 RepID=UPI003CFD5BE3
MARATGQPDSDLRGEHDALFAAAAAIIPSLKGRLVAAEEPWALLSASPHGNSGEVMAALFAHWRQAHPEAGPAYWLTRSWGMLCWQSIYLAVIAVYRFAALPALDRMGMGYQDGLVCGVALAPEPMVKGEHAALIQEAGRRLQRHWQALFETFAEVQRLRPGFVRPLLADDLLVALARVPDFFPEVSRERVSQDAPRWLAACDLPAGHLAGWRPASLPQAGLLPGYVRQRCCLHYKRRDGDLCGNCPRRQGAASCDDGA